VVYFQVESRWRTTASHRHHTEFSSHGSRFIHLDKTFLQDSINKHRLGGSQSEIGGPVNKCALHAHGFKLGIELVARSHFEFWELQRTVAQLEFAEPLT